MAFPTPNRFLQSEKQDRSNFWKSRSSGYSSSNYWLKDSLFDQRRSYFADETQSLEKESRANHFQLAQYQRAISNFVRILTGRSDIRVRYSQDGKNYTDGKTVTISPNIKEKEFDTAVGLALHEASHILYTDFPKWVKYIEDARSKDGVVVGEIKKTLLNIVEDVYIDAMTYRAAPGYRGYYSSLYQKYFGGDKIVDGLWSVEHAEPTWDNYLFHVCNIRNPERNLDALPGLRKIFDMLNLTNITRLSTFKERVDLSKMIYKEIQKYVQANDEWTAEMEQRLQNKVGKMSGAGNGAGNSQSRPMTAEEIEEFEKFLESMADEDGGENSEGNGGEEEQEANGSGTDGKENGEDTQEGQAQDNSGEGEEEKDTEPFTASNGVTREELEATNKSVLKNLSDKAKKGLEKLINQQREFINGNLNKGKITNTDQNKIDAWCEVEMDKKIVGSNSEFSKKGVPVYIIRSINENFMNNLGSKYGIHEYASKRNSDGINEAISRGKLLAKKLQLRNEERSLKTSRLNSGKIDKRLLHEIGFDNFDVFSKINITSYKPSFIHISLDQSGSMDGRPWFNAIEFAAMFATASKYIQNIHLVITTRSTFSNTGDYWDREYTPFLMTIFDSKKNSIQDIRRLFPRLRPVGATPEGLCFDAIMKETLSQAQNTDAYFINICDGEPWYSYNGQFDYTGDRARAHSREQMNRMIAGGISFITYFIGGDNGFEAVRECYRNNAVHLNNPAEITKIAATMNRKLLAV